MNVKTQHREKKDARKHDRIDTTRANVRIRLVPLMPKRAAYEGHLINISPGGLALLLPKALPEGSYWALQTELTKGSNMETLVQLRHSRASGRDFLHGFRFASIQHYLVERVQKTALA